MNRRSWLKRLLGIAAATTVANPAPALPEADFIIPKELTQNEVLAIRQRIEEHYRTSSSRVIIARPGVVVANADVPHSS